MFSCFSLSLVCHLLYSFHPSVYLLIVFPIFFLSPFSFLIIYLVSLMPFFSLNYSLPASFSSLNLFLCSCIFTSFLFILFLLITIFSSTLPSFHYYQLPYCFIVPVCFHFFIVHLFVFISTHTISLSLSLSLSHTD